MGAMTSELNWAGTYTYTAERIERPTSIEAVQELVSGAERVRGIGTRHSFNDVADGPGVLVDVTAIPADLEIAPDRRTVTLGAGTRYGDVAPALDAAGLALHNMGSLPHISVGGATATGTHGSGTRLGSLSSAVAGLEFVGGDGTLHRIVRGDPEHAGAVLHLGLLGVVTRITLDVEPTYRMRQDAYGAIPWTAFLGSVREVFAAGTSVCCFTNWDGTVREVLVKTRIPDGADDVAVPEAIVGAHRLPPLPGDDHRTARDGTPGPWWDRLPHFTVGTVPSVGSEIQSEHFVPLDRAAEALDAVHALGDRIRPHLHVAELRTTAPDDLWLSPGQGSATLCIAFTWRRHVDEVAALLPDIEAALVPFDARPHWGKMSSLGPDAIAALYPRLPAFRSLVARIDPERRFASAFGERVLGV
ncbi:FAD-binding protein [Curtobacterium sp. MCBD17_019]|uniref:FAD-binding protein n=1 Tax=Curtobacterium sp. MCBD17_019 TaxID=2175669 RepID=UPI000DA99BE9|nr:FAD-binding protein [Curtobacterium sp. MCBD17_019]PZE71533.1 FAD-binding protein [Curtobacterium sp. MCBD17_019]